MNNIQQKNILQKLYTNIDMPYMRHQFINYSSNNQSLNSIDLNNSLQQLLDNDLYLESKLVNTSAFIIGPKIYDSNTIESKPNGYKAYGDIYETDYLDILHKVDKDLSSTVLKSQAFNSNVNFICQYGNLTFASDSDSLKYSFDPKSDVWNEFDVRIQATDYVLTPNSLIFSSNQGIFQLSTFADYSSSASDPGKICYTLFQLNMNDIKNLTTIGYDKKNGKLLTCSKVKDSQFQLLEGNYVVLDDYSSEISSIKFSKKYLFSESDIANDKINKISFFTNGKGLLAGENGLYFWTKKSQLENRIVLKSDEIGITYEKCMYFNDELYIMTNRYVFKRIDEYNIEKILIGGLESVQMMVVKATDINAINGNLYISTVNSDSKSHLYRLDKDGKWTDLFSDILNLYEFDQKIEITKINEFNSTNLLLGTSKGLYSLNLNNFNKLGKAYLNIIDISEINNKKINDVYYNSSAKSIYIGTDNELVIQKTNKTSECNTTVISQVQKYSKDTLNQSIVKFLSVLKKNFIVSTNAVQSTNNTNYKWLCPDSTATITDAIIIDYISSISMIVSTTKSAYLLKIAQNGSLQYIKKYPNDFDSVQQVVQFKDLIVFRRESDIIVLSKNSANTESLIYNIQSIQAKNISFDDTYLYILGTDNKISSFLQNMNTIQSSVLQSKNITDIVYCQDAQMMLYSTDSGLSASHFELDTSSSEENIETESLLITDDSLHTDIGKVGDLNYLFNVQSDGVYQSELDAYSSDPLNDLRDDYSHAIKVFDHSANTICNIEKLSYTTMLDCSYSSMLIGTDDGIYSKELMNFSLSQIDVNPAKHMAVFTKTWLGSESPKRDDQDVTVVLSTATSKKIIACNDQIAYVVNDDGTAQVWDLDQSNGRFQSFGSGLNSITDIALVKPGSPSNSHCYDFIVRGNSVYLKKLDLTYSDWPTLSLTSYNEVATLESTIKNLDIIDNTNSTDWSSSIAYIMVACQNDLYCSNLTVDSHEEQYIYSPKEFKRVGYADGLTRISDISKAFFASDSVLIVQTTANALHLCTFQITADNEIFISSISTIDSGISSKISLIYKPMSNTLNAFTSVHGIYSGMYIVDLLTMTNLCQIESNICDEYNYCSELENTYYALGDHIYVFSLDVSSKFTKTSISRKINWLHYCQSQSKIYVVYNDNKLGFIEDFTSYSITDISDLPINTSRCYYGTSSNILYIVSQDKKYIYEIQCDDNGIPLSTSSFIKTLDYNDGSNVVNGVLFNETVEVSGVNIKLFSKIFCKNNYNERLFMFGNGIHYIHGYSVLQESKSFIDAYDLVLNDESVLSYISIDRKKIFYSGEFKDSTLEIAKSFRYNKIIFSKCIDNNWYYGNSIDHSIPFQFINSNNYELTYYSILGGNSVIGTNAGAFEIVFLKNVVINCLDKLVHSQNVLQFDYKNSTSSKFIQKKTANDYIVNIYSYTNNTINQYQLSSKYNILNSNDQIISSVYEVPSLQQILFCKNSSNTIYAKQNSVTQEYLENLSTTYKIDGIDRKADFELGRDYLNYSTGKLLEYYDGIQFSGINSAYKNDQTNFIACEIGVVCFTNYLKNDTGYQIINGSNGQVYYNIIDDSSEVETKLINGSSYLNSFDQNNLYFIKEIKSHAFTKYNFLSSDTYMIESDKNILTSLNYKTWDSLLSLAIDSDYVNSILPIDAQTYFFATDNGLFFTKYQYSIIHDIKNFSYEEAMNLYNNLLSSNGGISDLVYTTLSNHLSDDHNSGSIITRLNSDFVDVNMEDIINWQKTNDENNSLVINNDIIAEMTFGDYSDGDIIVQISNFTTLNDDLQNEYEELSNFNYIMKRWMSGVTELYININTTKTYYLPNLYGASDCRVSPSTKQTRKNLDIFSPTIQDQDGVLSTHYTNIKVDILSTEYHIDNLLDVQINGNSLPLRMYKTLENSNPGSQQFRSFIQPSVVKGYDISNTDVYGYYPFRFACFGTDSQVIKVTFYDQTAKINKPWIRIVFDANGGEGIMSKQKFLIDEETGTLIQKQLKQNRFKNTSAGYEKTFMGWTLTPQSENYTQEEEVDDGTQVYSPNGVFPHQTDFKKLMKELMRDEDQTFIQKEEITLYAVWFTYKFTDEDTTLLMNSNQTDFYIEYVEVDKSTSLKENVAISYGEN